MDATEEHELNHLLWETIVQQRPQCVLLHTAHQWDTITLDTHPIRTGCGARIILPLDNEEEDAALFAAYILGISKRIRDSTRPRELVFMHCAFEPDEDAENVLLWKIQWRSPGPPVQPVQNN
jgi:hypothetical protein